MFFYWIFIIIGTILYSFSLSNKFYLLFFSKYYFMTKHKLIFRSIYFILGTFFVFFGLYLESLISF